MNMNTNTNTSTSKKRSTRSSKTNETNETNETALVVESLEVDKVDKVDNVVKATPVSNSGTTPMLTQSYYLNRLAKSKDLDDLFMNYFNWVLFIQRKCFQSVYFSDPTLIFKSM